MKIWEDVLINYPDLAGVTADFTVACDMVITAYRNGGRVLACGNGGSAADCEHIVGELMKEFLLPRKLTTEQAMAVYTKNPKDGPYLAAHLQGALPAIALCGHSALTTAFLNDVAPDMVFAQQVFGYGRPGDVLLALSTSGNSNNVVNAVKVAHSFGLHVIGFTGQTGGKLAELCDVCIKAPSTETYRVQEYHLPIYHALCAAVENAFFGGKGVNSTIEKV